jgi:hypothetical protein
LLPHLETSAADTSPKSRRISTKLLGSGTELTPAGPTVVCDEKFDIVVVPSKFTLTVNANPSTRSLVRAGVVPSGSENTLNANALPEVDVPSGELNAGP